MRSRWIVPKRKKEFILRKLEHCHQQVIFKLNFCYYKCVLKSCYKAPNLPKHFVSFQHNLIKLGQNSSLCKPLLHLKCNWNKNCINCFYFYYLKINNFLPELDLLTVWCNAFIIIKCKSKKFATVYEKAKVCFPLFLPPIFLFFNSTSTGALSALGYLELMLFSIKGFLVRNSCLL